MAAGTSGPAAEHGQATLRGSVERRSVARDISVVGRIASLNRSHVCGKRERDLSKRAGIVAREPAVWIDRSAGAYGGPARAGYYERVRAAAERLCESVAVTVGSGKCDDSGGGHREFVRVNDRLKHLILERGGAAIPEETPAPCTIEQRRNVARAKRAAHTFAETLAVGQRTRRVVTTGAGSRAVSRQTTLVEQAAAEVDLGRRQRIVVRNRPVQIEPTQASWLGGAGGCCPEQGGRSQAGCQPDDQACAREKA